MTHRGSHRQGAARFWRGWPALEPNPGIAPAAPSTTGNPAWSYAILALLAVVSRAQFFGNPILASDEGFYLLVGDRMLHGALPYVDIWDRKPIGLFILYAAMRLLGGDGVLAYQLVGTGFAFATSVLIARIARSFATSVGATAAGCAYLIWLTLGSAAGGQAELFYGLPVCAAAAITMQGFKDTRPSGLWWRGGIAMLLIGLAAQIKYNALFEGMYFGCCWLILGWRSGRRAMLAPYAGFWIVAAVAPTVAAASYYAFLKQLDPFLFANFISIWQRSSAPAGELLERLAIIAGILAPLLACVRPRLRLVDPAANAAFRFTLWWLAATIASVLAFGTYLEQYLLPIVIPASAAAAPFFGGGGGARRWKLAALGAIFLLGQTKLWVTQLSRGSPSELSAIGREIDPDKCLFVYSGVAAFYRVAGACIPTRFAFPSHLSRERESQSIGVDTVSEVNRIMRSRPGTVIVRSPYAGDENWPARAETFRHLRADYRLVLVSKLGWQTVEVYQLVGQPAPPGRVPARGR